jgi:hypothetical protein
MRIRIQLPKLMRIRIQLPKLKRIRIRNSAHHGTHLNMVPELSGAGPCVEVPCPLVAKKPGTEHAAQLEAEGGGQAAVRRHLHQCFGSLFM